MTACAVTAAQMTEFLAFAAGFVAGMAVLVLLHAVFRLAQESA